MSKLQYELIRSARKTVSIEISREARLIVRAPLKMRSADIDAFVESKRAWIEKHLLEVKKKLESAPPKLTADQISELKKYAKRIIPLKAARFATLMGVKYNNIAFRNQKTRYGSCSGKKNLNFNIAIMLMPEEIIDYVIVHELSHLKEMNHSDKFWKEVERVLPDYKRRRDWLKKNGISYIQRLQ